MCKCLPLLEVRVCALSGWTFSAREQGSDAWLRNHFILTNIPQSAENYICMFVVV